MTSLQIPERRSVPTPTSFPSFYHQDHAYAEVLNLDPGTDLSGPWQRRVDAWKKLLVLWLLGKVQERSVPIPDALRPFVPIPADGTPFPDEVTWLLKTGPATPTPLGVLSPVILVRPLPDPDALVAELAPAGIAELRLVERLLSRLKDDVSQAAATNFPPAVRLSRILARHFQTVAPLGPTAGHPRGFTLLNHRTLERHGIVLQLGERQPGFVPSCGTCGRVLLPASASVAPGATEVVVRCECGASQNISLASLFCGWSSSTPSRLVAWQDRPPLFAEGAPPTPPSPQVLTAGNESVLRFEFGAADHPSLVRLAPADRCVELRFPLETTVLQARVEGVMYPMRLQPRTGPGVRAVPIRPEHLDLWDGRIEEAGPAAVAVGLRGLPGLVKLSAARTDGESVAVFPDPDKVPPGWQRFEVLSQPGPVITVGSGRSESGRCHVNRVPNAVGVALAGGAGYTLVTEPVKPTEPAMRLRLAVDFGTTNSIVYVRRQAEGGQWRDDVHRPSDLRQQAVRWLSGPPSDVALDQLFPRTTGDPLIDAFVPSELCVTHKRIRTAAALCCDQWHAFFKNDPQASGLRRQYWRELLSGAVAGAVSRLHGVPSSLSLECIFTFPLTFSYRDVERFKAELDTLKQDLSTDLGLPGPATITLVDEPSAGVLSLGVPAASDAVLIADLGGGTLDVAFGKGLGAAAVAGEAGAPEWIGSLDLGGRFLLQAVGDARVLQDQIRRRDSVARVLFDDTATQHALDRYFSAIGYYLAVLALSKLRDEATSSIRFYPLGNGWRLYDLTASDQLSPQDLYRTRMRAFTSRLDKFLSESLRRPITVRLEPSVPPPGWHPKHAVARGAMHSRAEQAARVRLPAGIDLVVPNQNGKRVSWWTPVGPTVDGWEGLVLDQSLLFDGVSLATSLNLFCAGSGAPLPFGSDAESIVRRELIAAENAVPSPHNPTGYLRAPLQLLAEKVWRENIQ